MAKEIDKTRAEQEGAVAFVGTGVGVDTEVTREDDDLTEKIRAIVAGMLSNLGTESEEVLGETVQNINTLIFNRNDDLWDELSQIWNAIENLGSGSGAGVNVYKWVSNNAISRRYNCYLQEWIAGKWKNVDENIVVVDYETGPPGHAFNEKVFFHSLGEPDLNDVVPVDVMEMSIKKAYVKTTPGATTTLACYLDKDTTGTEISVACVIDGGGNLNAATPRLTDGEYIWVKRVGAAWVNVTPFHVSVVPTVVNDYAAWFLLTATASSPMTATKVDTSETGISVAIHPNSHIDNYANGEYVYAAKSDGTWTSVNLFSSQAELEDLLHDAPTFVMCE